MRAQVQLDQLARARPRPTRISSAWRASPAKARSVASTERAPYRAMDRPGRAARAACTDAERRAANRLHDRLRAAGHEAWVETVWVRPRWAWSIALHCALTAIGGLVAIAAPVAGLVVAALGARRPRRRGAEPPRAAAAPDAPARDPERARRAAARDRAAVAAGRPATTRRRRAAPRASSPGCARGSPLCALAVTRAPRAASPGVDGTALGAVQLVPTVALLLGAAVAADAALAAPTRRRPPTASTLDRYSAGPCLRARPAARALLRRATPAVRLDVARGAARPTPRDRPGRPAAAT